MARLVDLRLRRLRHGISRDKMATRMNCSQSWISTLELRGYDGPAYTTWVATYKMALDQLVAEKREAAREARRAAATRA